MSTETKFRIQIYNDENHKLFRTLTKNYVSPVDAFNPHIFLYFGCTPILIGLAFSCLNNGEVLKMTPPTQARP